MIRSNLLARIAAGRNGIRRLPGSQLSRLGYILRDAGSHYPGPAFVAERVRTGYQAA